MAILLRDGQYLTLKLSAIEKVESVHGDIRIPESAISGIRIIDDILKSVHGIRAPGTNIPGVLAMGTFWSQSEKLFVMIHHHEHRGVRIDLVGQPFNALLFSHENPEQLVHDLGLNPITGAEHP